METTKDVLQDIRNNELNETDIENDLKEAKERIAELEDEISTFKAYQKITKFFYFVFVVTIIITTYVLSEGNNYKKLAHGLDQKLSEITSLNNNEKLALQSQITQKEQKALNLRKEIDNLIKSIRKIQSKHKEEIEHLNTTISEKNEIKSSLNIGPNKAIGSQKTTPTNKAQQSEELKSSKKDSSAITQENNVQENQTDLNKPLQESPTAEGSTQRTNN